MDSLPEALQASDSLQSLSLPALLAAIVYLVYRLTLAVERIAGSFQRRASVPV